jgi:hypothetical protein
MTFKEWIVTVKPTGNWRTDMQLGYEAATAEAEKREAEARRKTAKDFYKLAIRIKKQGPWHIGGISWRSLGSMGAVRITT